MGANHYTYWDGVHWMNLFDFNLYGDPAMSISISGNPAPTVSEYGMIVMALLLITIGAVVIRRRGQ